MTEAEKYFQKNSIIIDTIECYYIRDGQKLKFNPIEYAEGFKDEQVEKTLEAVEDSLMSDDSKSFFCEDCKHTIDVKLKRNPCKCVECGGKLQRDRTKKAIG